VPWRLALLLQHLSPSGPPAFAVLPNPVEQGAFEPYVVAKALRFNPLVFQDFLPFGQEFLIKTGLFHELSGRR
jgi:hypothetical protein